MALAMREEKTPAREMIQSGSYDPRDVQFLLSPMTLDLTSIEEKERRIQAGAAHYSEMLSEEKRPDPIYLSIFEQALAVSTDRMAREISAMARRIVAEIAAGRMPAEITVCSLVRAGVPFGVILRRALARLGVDVVHFGISIIRDRGIDMVAMRHVMAHRDPRGIIFVDGWTGKGAITLELRKSWMEETGREPLLAVLADPCGYANLSGSHEDWLIPSGILGANVSGLISRSILTSEILVRGDFHGFMPVDHLRDLDASRRFVDTICASAAFLGQETEASPLHSFDAIPMLALRAESARIVDRIMGDHKVSNRNRVKPGIAEATRAVLRRKPAMVFLRSDNDPDLQAILHLCRGHGVPVTISSDHTGPYRAVTLIAEV